MVLLFFGAVLQHAFFEIDGSIGTAGHGLCSQQLVLPQAGTVQRIHAAQQQRLTQTVHHTSMLYRSLV